jgi:cytidine deaminase
MVEVGESEKKLLEAGLKAMKHAYVHWGFRVGAAVLGTDGKIYEGCNVESWISGLGTCAERSAINHAILHGNRKIRQVAIVMDANKPHQPRPCGACLQYIHDFATSPKAAIIMAKAHRGKVLCETIQTKTLREMLPYPYRK